MQRGINLIISQAHVLPVPDEAHRTTVAKRSNSYE